MTGFSANKVRASLPDPYLTGLVAFTVMLMLVTIINQFLIDPFEPMSPPIVVVGPGAVAGGSPSAVTLATDQPGHIVRRDFRIANPKEASHLRVRADVRLRGVVPGNRRWKQARILLNIVQPDGELYWESPHVVFRGWGDLIAPHVQTMLPGSTLRDQINLRVELLLARGEIQVNSLSVVPSRLSGAAQRSERFLLVAWVTLIAAWSLFLLVRNWRRPSLFILAPCWLATMIVIGLSTMPSGQSQSIFNIIWAQVTWVENQLPDFSNQPPVTRAHIVHQQSPTAPANVQSIDISAEEAAVGRFTLSKIAHVGVFVLIGGLFALYGLGKFWTPLASVVLFSLVTELMQTFAISRQPSLFDAGLNTGGAVGGVMLMVVLLAIIRRLLLSR